MVGTTKQTPEPSRIIAEISAHVEYALVVLEENLSSRKTRPTGQDILSAPRADQTSACKTTESLSCKSLANSRELQLRGNISTISLPDVN